MLIVLALEKVAKVGFLSPLVLGLVELHLPALEMVAKGWMLVAPAPEVVAKGWQLPLWHWHMSMSPCQVPSSL